MDEQNTTNPNEKNEASEQAVKETPKQSKPKHNNKEKKSSFSDTIADYKAEFRKIIWPKKDEMIKKTVTVVFTSLLVGVIIFGIDTVYSFGYDLIIKALG